jgi:CubicO group peptidase (beta-lactamase class C family)
VVHNLEISAAHGSHQSDGQLRMVRRTVCAGLVFFAWSCCLALSQASAGEPSSCSLAGKQVAPTNNNSNTYDATAFSKPPALDDGIDVGNIAISNVGISCINALIAKINLPPDQGGFQDLHSLLVFKDGELLLEEYFEGNDDYIDFENGIQRINRPSVQWGRDKKHYIASINKSLTANLTGIALQQLQMVVHQTLAPSLPAYQAFFEDPEKAAITWQDMLTMQAGFVWDEWEADDLEQLWKSSDFTQFLLSKDSNGPQSEWRYNSAVPNVILHALENLLEEPVREWAHREFYQPLGITDYLWESQPGGYPEGSARMFMRPRDMLKIGITWLNGGVWQGRQVIPASWVEAMMTKQTSSPAGDYSYFSWLRELNGVSYFSADGDGGQYINVLPEHNLVIVMTAGNYSQWLLYKNQVDDMMANYLFPAFLDSQD